MAKTKIISSTRLENVVIYLAYDKTGKVSARVTAIGQTLVNGEPEETVSVELDYGDLGSSEKNQLEGFIKHLSKLLNQEGAAENSETIDKIG